jgi:hypothetical protein
MCAAAARLRARGAWRLARLDLARLDLARRPNARHRAWRARRAGACPASHMCLHPAAVGGKGRASGAGRQRRLRRATPDALDQLGGRAGKQNDAAQFFGSVVDLMVAELVRASSDARLEVPRCSGGAAPWRPWRA